MRIELHASRLIWVESLRWAKRRRAAALHIGLGVVCFEDFSVSLLLEQQTTSRRDASATVRSDTLAYTLTRFFSW